MIFWVIRVKSEIIETGTRDMVIPQYISALIREATEKDPSRNHDVALISMEIRTKSELLFDIAKQIAKENPRNPVLIHELQRPIDHHSIHAASFIVILSDASDPVRIKLKKFESQ